VSVNSCPSAFQSRPFDREREASDQLEIARRSSVSIVVESDVVVAMLAPWVVSANRWIVREVADRLASNRDGFFLYEYASNMPNDQAITHRRIRVIPPPWRIR